MSQLTVFGKTYRDRVDAACSAIAAGKGIILVDDEDRENEGDLIFSAEKVSTFNINQMIQDCSGIICLCLTKQKADSLSLTPMVKHNSSRYQTAFTTSIEAKHGVTTGVSAQDRWQTIHVAIQENATPFDLTQPGHIFPLIACDNGVLERRGHTEGSIDMMRLAGLNHSAVLCELMNTDGTMKKLKQLIQYAIDHQLTILSIEDIYQYRLQFGS